MAPLTERPPGAAAGGVRWIPPLRLGGAWQMAIDEWLLDQAVAAAPQPGEAVLRLYRWPRPTLSLGFHQHRLPAHWLELAAAGVIELVRRPSGGRAVLHAGDLTYALVWPDPPRRRPEAYAQACGWLQRAFADLGLPLGFGGQAATGERASCFATSTAADLVHGGGGKRIGSAQLWRRGVLLQHGSILVRPPRDLWRQLFGHDPPALPPLPLDDAALEERLRRAAERHLPLGAGAAVRWREAPLAAAELAAIAARLGRYRPDPEAAAGRGVTSPAATMPRAT